MPTELATPKYIDDLTCRELWVETAQVLNGPPGTVRIELCVYRWTPDVPVHVDRVVPAARIAMHVGLAQLLRDQLTALLEAAERDRQLALAPAASPTKN